MDCGLQDQTSCLAWRRARGEPFNCSTQLLQCKGPAGSVHIAGVRDQTSLPAAIQLALRILTHGSIVAREYNIPAVLGLGIATKRIKHRQMIRVDGDHGVVALLDD